MFYGEARHNLDSKSRVVFPARWRDELGSPVFLRRGEERCVTVWPAHVYERQLNAVLAQPSTTTAQRDLRREFFARVSDERVDAQGRLLISAPFREYAGLEAAEVVIAGMGDHLEIWEPGAWENRMNELESDLGDLQQRATT